MQQIQIQQISCNMTNTPSMNICVFQGRGYFVRMNHVDLLNAVLLHCGVPEEKHQHVLTILCDNKVFVYCIFVTCDYVSSLRLVVLS